MQMQMRNMYIEEVVRLTPLHIFEHHLYFSWLILYAILNVTLIKWVGIFVSSVEFRFAHTFIGRNCTWKISCETSICQSFTRLILCKKLKHNERAFRMVWCCKWGQSLPCGAPCIQASPHFKCQKNNFWTPLKLSWANVWGGIFDIIREAVYVCKSKCVICLSGIHDDGRHACVVCAHTTIATCLAQIKRHNSHKAFIRKTTLVWLNSTYKLPELKCMPYCVYTLRHFIYMANCCRTMMNVQAHALMSLKCRQWTRTHSQVNDYAYKRGRENGLWHSVKWMWNHL